MECLMRYAPLFIVTRYREGFASEWLVTALVLVTAPPPPTIYSLSLHHVQIKSGSHTIPLCAVRAKLLRDAFGRIRSGRMSFLAPSLFLFTNCHPAPVRISHLPLLPP